MTCDLVFWTYIYVHSIDDVYTTYRGNDMKYVKCGKVYNTDTSKKIYFDGDNVFYHTAKGNFFSVSDETGEVRSYSEIEVMDEYLNYLERNGMTYDKEDEVNEELLKLVKYVEDLIEA